MEVLESEDVSAHFSQSLRFVNFFSVCGVARILFKLRQKMAPKFLKQAP